MKKNYTLHKLLSLTLLLSMVGLFTACGCGRSTTDENNNTANTTESGMNGGTTNNGNGSSTGNTTESGIFNGSMGNDNAFGTTDGMVDGTTNGTDEGIVGGVVDDIVGGVDDMLNTTETGTGNSTNNTRNMGR